MAWANEYYAITDHAPNLVMQRMTDEKMLAQRAQVRALDAKHLAAGQAACLPPQGPLSLTGTRIVMGSTGEKWCRTRSI
jgi:hypothetical protein